MTRELSIRLLFTVVTRAAIVLFFFCSILSISNNINYGISMIEFRETLSLLKRNNDRLERKIAVIETEGEILGR